jgi:hypothetical protein
LPSLKVAAFPQAIPMIHVKSEIVGISLTAAEVNSTYRIEEADKFIDVIGEFSRTSI